MPTIRPPIVGIYYHPPAQAILQILPFNTPLLLVPEPTNHKDPNAIMVCIQSENIPNNVQLDDLAKGYGHDNNTIHEAEVWHLGYVPAKIAEAIHLSNTTNGKLYFGADGTPQVEFEAIKK